jgi:hypothetical protein
MPSQSFDKRRLVGVLPERITNVSNREFPGHDPNHDFAWNLLKFKKVRFFKNNACQNTIFFWLLNKTRSQR